LFFIVYANINLPKRKRKEKETKTSIKKYKLKEKIKKKPPRKIFFSLSANRNYSSLLLYLSSDFIPGSRYKKTP
jgi:hypothetical protein